MVRAPIRLPQVDPSSPWLLALLLGLSACDRAPAPPGSENPRAAREESAPAPTPTPTPTPESPSGEPKGRPAEESVKQDEGVPRDGPRVYAKSRNVWIRSGPTTDTQWIGFLWWGGSVRVRDEKPLAGLGCSRPWTPVEPRGWVCASGEEATTDPDDPVLSQMYPFRPRVETPWPHEYAAVHQPIRRYETLPDPALQKAWELNYERHMSAVRAARQSGTVPAELGALDPSLVGREAPRFLPLPTSLSEKRTRVAPRSAFAYSSAFDHEDRAFLLAADLTWIPKDRVELLPRVEFQGLELQGDVRLPLAFFRSKERPAYVKNAQDEFEKSDTNFARLSHVLLTGETERRDKITYHKVQGQELWVSHREAVIPTPRDKTPWGAAVGEPDTTGLAPGGRATWLEGSLLGGWLIAYEGTRPVYVTMISTGRGGTPQPGRDTLSTASTPTGRFSINGKFKTATMESSSTPIIHGDVPWTQNFIGPYAIHSAYWHDDWGQLKSAGCVNVAPRDGKWLFEFTEPEVPEGWHGVKHVSRYGNSTILLLRD